MKIRKTLPIFIVFMIISSSILFGILINSQTNINLDTNYTPNSIIVEFNNFNSFQVLYNELEIESHKSDSKINFKYTGGSTTFFLMKYYYLEFDSYGSCSDFEMQVTIDYNYTGSIHFGRFEFTAGSYYNESGQYSGKPEGLIEGSPCLPARPLCKSNVVDAWTGFEGEFRVFAWPNDIGEKYITAHGPPGSNGTATFHMKRENTDLYGQVNKSGITQIDHTWTTGVTKPVNFIMVGVGIYGSTNFANATYYDFSAKLNCTGIPITSPIAETITYTSPAGMVFSFTIISSIIGLSIYIIADRKLKKK